MDFKNPNLPKIGDVVKGYTIRNTIGKTNYSFIFCASSENNSLVALKFIQPYQDDKSYVENEINILKQCQCKQINTLIETFEYNNFTCLVMPYANGGNLKNFIQNLNNPLTEDQIRQIAYDAFTAVQYLHSHNIWHRDIKIDNFLVDTNNNSSSPSILLSDFGLSKQVNPGDIVSDHPGTFECAAPEVITCNSYDSSIDMWGLGVFLYHLIGGNNPFPAFPQSATRRCILKGAYFFPDHLFKRVSKEARILIDHLIQVDPKKRYTADEALQSSWFDPIKNR